MGTELQEKHTLGFPGKERLAPWRRIQKQRGEAAEAHVPARRPRAGTGTWAGFPIVGGVA